MRSAVVAVLVAAAALAPAVLFDVPVVLAGSPAVSVEEPTDGTAVPAASADLADLSWIAGHWRGSLGEDGIEEVWLPAAGGEMVGMFRWLKGGELFLYELFTIELGPEGPRLLLRHFDSGLTAWEEKGEPMRFEPAAFADGEAAFVHPPNGTRLTYRRRGDDGLEVELLHDGDPAKTSVFAYRRVGS